MTSSIHIKYNKKKIPHRQNIGNRGNKGKNDQDTPS